MRSHSLARGAACAFAACLIAGAAAAQERRVSPWYGSGIKPIPLGQGQSTVLRGAFHEAPFIRHLYRGFLGREPSQDEVRAWGRELGKETGPTGLVRYFMESDEYFIRQSYLGLLRREPDPSGRDAFSRLLRSGGSRADVVESILRSEEFRRLAPETQAPPPPPRPGVRRRCCLPPRVPAAGPRRPTRARSPRASRRRRRSRRRRCSARPSAGRAARSGRRGRPRAPRRRAGDSARPGPARR